MSETTFGATLSSAAIYVGLFGVYLGLTEIGGGLRAMAKAIDRMADVQAKRGAQ